MPSTPPGGQSWTRATPSCAGAAASSHGPACPRVGGPGPPRGRAGGGPFVVSLLGLRHPVGGRQEELLTACDAVQHAAGQSRLALYRLCGDQASAYRCTLPLCRGLRSGRWTATALPWPPWRSPASRHQAWTIRPTAPRRATWWCCSSTASTATCWAATAARSSRRRTSTGSPANGRSGSPRT